MTRYRTLKVDDLEIFYREAGPPDAPVLLLLHGFPSSSRMYEPLLRHLADRWRLIAPDYPGSGHSSAPAPTGFAYTFDHVAEVMNGFVDTLGIERHTLFVQDYGGPVGLRTAMAHPTSGPTPRPAATTAADRPPIPTGVASPMTSSRPGRLSWPTERSPRAGCRRTTTCSPSSPTSDLLTGSRASRATG